MPTVFLGQKVSLGACIWCKPLFMRKEDANLISKTAFYIDYRARNLYKCKVPFFENIIDISLQHSLKHIILCM